MSSCSNPDIQAITMPPAVIPRRRDLLRCLSSSIPFTALACLYLIHAVASSISRAIYENAVFAFFSESSFSLNCAWAVICLVYHRRVAWKLDVLQQSVCSKNFLTEADVASARKKSHIFHFMLLFCIFITFLLLIVFIAYSGEKGYFIRFTYGIDITRAKLDHRVAELLTFTETTLCSVILLVPYLFQIKFASLCDLISLRTKHLHNELAVELEENSDEIHSENFAAELAFLWTKVAELDECLSPVIFGWCMCITLSLVSNIHTSLLLEAITIIDLQAFWMVPHDIMFLILFCAAAGRIPEQAQRFTLFLPQLVDRGEKLLSQHIHVITSDFSVSAWGCFYVNRWLILAVAGVVFTYIFSVIQVQQGAQTPNCQCAIATEKST